MLPKLLFQISVKLLKDGAPVISIHLANIIVSIKIKWFNSYLTNRAFSVSLNNGFSEVGIINCGVPQRSIL